MRRLAALSHDHRRLVATVWIVFIAAAGALAAGVGSGYVNNFTLPGTESQRALDLLRDRFPQQAGDTSQIVFHVQRGSLNDPATKAKVNALVAEVSKLPSVSGAVSPYASAGTISQDGKTAYASLLFDRQAVDLDKADVDRVVDTAHDAATGGLQVELGGQAIQMAERPETGAGEVIGIVVAIVVLVLVLGSAVAMAMPLLSAFAAIAAAMGLVYAATGAFSIADFAPTLAVMIALGVGIDYALLVINRFRGERAGGADVREATLTAMDTAGRSVLFAGTTVVIALLGMLLLGVSFLNGPAIASAAAVAVTMLSSLTLLPALLGFWGRRVKVPSIDVEHAEPRGWGRWSALVARRPGAFAAGALVVLLLVASPVLGIRLGSSDAGNNNPSTTTRKAYDLLSRGFGPGFNGPLLVVAEVKPGDGGQAQLVKLRGALSKARDVAAVSQPNVNEQGDAATLTVIPASKPQDAATKDLLSNLRDHVVPGVRAASGGALEAVSIGGATASTVDFGDVLAGKLPLFIGVVIGLSLLLLAVVFRSLLIPAKAAVLNLLSIGAALGVITFIFQDGHLASLIGVETTSPIEPFLPVMLFAIIFGLSMDYEVFLVTRMHEEWEHTKDAGFAVRHGLALTGKVVMAAAIIMISVFGSFVLGDDRTIKLFGVGLASAVLFDAFVIRLVLVPALMHLFGRASWWMPAWLDARLPRLSIEGPAEEAENRVKVPA
ncbi:MAG TPA: MMPL family transporter [Baekduia sp.]|uniref:MMPL family transporter n=1 Tax=Baekduia sp. TaxID=2600305 RepID=UPI002D791009|nr:MMPL family transporter [Baekduia sp.]HET6506215.1 MMPL family transporter [Baekduia sp.]